MSISAKQLRELQGTSREELVRLELNDLFETMEKIAKNSKDTCLCTGRLLYLETQETLEKLGYKIMVDGNLDTKISWEE